MASGQARTVTFEEWRAQLALARAVAREVVALSRNLRNAAVLRRALWRRRGRRFAASGMPR
jgi:hypothetical protein